LPAIAGEITIIGSFAKMDKIQCSVFSVDFEENFITFRVPPAVLERGVKSGFASIDFSAIDGARKTSEQGESPATDRQQRQQEISVLLHKINIEVTAACGEGRVINLVREAQKLLA